MKLIIEDDEGRKTVVPFVRDEISIGRKEGNTIRLTERNVSRRHARLVRGGAHVFIEDLGSYNGVKVNGGRVQGRSEIREGDLIEIGDYNLAVQAEAGELASPATEPAATPLTTQEEPTEEHQVADGPGRGPAPPPMPTRAPAAAAAAPAAAAPAPRPAAPSAPRPAAPSIPPPEPLPRREATAVIRVDLDALNRDAASRPVAPADQPRLVVLSTEYAGQSFQIDRTPVTLGRDEANEVPIDHRSMSRAHCRVYQEKDGSWKVVDLGSANGVKVNGEPYGVSDLRPGDVIQLGHVKLRFCAPGDPFELTDDMAAAYAGGDDELMVVKRSSAPLWIGVIAVLVVGGGSAWWFLGRRAGSAAGPDTSGPQPLHAVATHAAHPVHPAAPAAGAPTGTGTAAAAAGTPAAAGRPTHAAEAATTPAPAKTPPKAHAAEVDTGALLAKAREAEHRQDWDGARRDYREVLAVHPDSGAATKGAQRAAAEARAKAAYDDAVSAVSHDDLDGALKDLDQVPGDSVYAHKAAAVRGRIKARQAAAHRKLVAEARTRRRAAAHAHHAAKQNAAAARKDEAQKDYKQGYALILKYKYRQAISYLKKALALDPVGMAPAHRLLGVAYASVGQMDKAAYHYREYIKKNPNAPDRSKVEQILQQYDQSTGK